MVRQVEKYIWPLNVPCGKQDGLECWRKNMKRMSELNRNRWSGEPTVDSECKPEELVSLLKRLSRVPLPMADIWAIL